MCVFLTLNRSSTRRHPAHPVSILILHPRKISSVVTSYDTEIMHRNAFDNAMSCPSTGCDRHNIHTSATEIHWKREYEINKNKNKNKIIIRKHVKTKYVSPDTHTKPTAHPSTPEKKMERHKNQEKRIRAFCEPRFVLARRRRSSPPLLCPARFLP